MYGVLPKALVFYAKYEGSTTRERLAAIMNAMYSGMDVANTVLVLRGIPAGARVRNKGWPTYWK